MQHEEGNCGGSSSGHLHTLLHKMFIFEYNCSHKYGAIPGELPRRKYSTLSVLQNSDAIRKLLKHPIAGLATRRQLNTSVGRSLSSEFHNF